MEPSAPDAADVSLSAVREFSVWELKTGSRQHGLGMPVNALVVASAQMYVRMQQSGWNAHGSEIDKGIPRNPTKFFSLL